MSPTFSPPPEPGEIDAAKAAELRTSRANAITELEDHEGTVVKLAASAIIEWAHAEPMNDEGCDPSGAARSMT